MTKDETLGHIAVIDSHIQRNINHVINALPPSPYKERSSAEIASIISNIRLANADLKKRKAYLQAQIGQ